MAQRIAQKLKEQKLTNTQNHSAGHRNNDDVLRMPPNAAVVGTTQRGGPGARTRVKLQRRATKRGSRRRGGTPASRRGHGGGGVYGKSPMPASRGISLAYGGYQSFAGHGPGHTPGGGTVLGGFPMQLPPPGAGGVGYAVASRPISPARAAAVAAIGAAANTNTGPFGLGHAPPPVASAQTPSREDSSTTEGPATALPTTGPQFDGDNPEEALEAKCTRLVTELEQAREVGSQPGWLLP